MHCDVSVLHAGVVKEIADDGAGSINPIAVRRCRAGKIDLRERAVLVKESVAVAGRVSKAAHNKSQTFTPKATEFAAPGGSIWVKMPRWRVNA